MKLSEAIRLGAMLRPQEFGRLFKNGGSCAMGAAIEASGIRCYRDDVFTSRELVAEASVIFPLLGRRFAMPPGTQSMWYEDTPRVWSIIARLNNSPNHWTRERIAAFVESIELQQEASQASASLENVTVTSQSS